MWMVLITLYQLRKRFGEATEPDRQRTYRQMTRIIATFWGVYLLGYLLTVVDIDFNWIHIAYTIGDIVTYVSVGVMMYFSNQKPLEHWKR